MIRSIVVATLIIVGACAAMSKTKPVETPVIETHTDHIRGTRHPYHPELEDPK